MLSQDLKLKQHWPLQILLLCLQNKTVIIPHVAWRTFVSMRFVFTGFTYAVILNKTVWKTVFESGEEIITFRGKEHDVLKTVLATQKLEEKKRSFAFTFKKKLFMSRIINTISYKVRKELEKTFYLLPVPRKLTEISLMLWSQKFKTRNTRKSWVVTDEVGNNSLFLYFPLELVTLSLCLPSTLLYSENASHILCEIVQLIKIIMLNVERLFLTSIYIWRFLLLVQFWNSSGVFGFSFFFQQ